MLDILKKAHKRGRFKGSKCACGGNLEHIDAALTSCADCGIQYCLVEGKKQPIFSYNQKLMLGTAGIEVKDE